MFDTLDDKIKRDDALETTPRERIFKNVAIVVLSVFLFGGLYFAVKFVE
jgi:hypothetical protein